MPQYQFPNLLDGRTPRCHATSTETYPDLENLPHLPGPTNHFLPYIGHRTPQETIPLSVPLSSFSFSTSFWFSVFGVFWVFCFFVFCFFCFMVCDFCVFGFCVFRLVNHLTPTFNRNFLIHYYYLIYLIMFYCTLFFVLCIYFVICICYFA